MKNEKEEKKKAKMQHANYEDFFLKNKILFDKS